MITKKEANKLRSKELRKLWKKKFLSKTLQKLPIEFQEEYKDLVKPDMNKVQNYYIHGETGSGKTVLACFMFIRAVKNRYMRYGYYPAIKSKFINFPSFLVELQSVMGKPEYHEKIAEVLSSDILVLDDLDARRITDWMVDLIYNAVNIRQTKNKITIITSNNDINKLSDILNDDRIIRRIEKSYKIVKKQHYSTSESKGK